MPGVGPTDIALPPGWLQQHGQGSGLMKYTLLLTQECNLACDYCYVAKKRERMTREVAERIVDFMFKHTPPEEPIQVAFFGGEPLLAFDLVQEVTELIESHPAFDRSRVEFSLVTNGTICSPDIFDYLETHGITFCLSCDGAPAVQDISRRYPNGQGSSGAVEHTLREAKERLPVVLVNAVYTPRTVQYLPQTVEYFARLGLDQIYLNPDFSSSWTPDDVRRLEQAYAEVAECYIRYYLEEQPRFISLIDSKIVVILRKGYQALERCRMGRGEFAFAPDGDIYPCERLLGPQAKELHCIGNIRTGLELDRMQCRRKPGASVNPECAGCTLKDYCMTWCGCSNYLATGYYNRVSPFICASEKAAIKVAFDVFARLEKRLGPVFSDHWSGSAVVNSRLLRL
jgi:uncharacterized protein